ncbi:MAG: DNA adenine methylase, partial [Hymenobacter sp.]
MYCGPKVTDFISGEHHAGLAPTKQLVPYYGGKQRMAKKLIPFIYPHTVYVEPFCGGATMLYQKPWPKVANNNNYREVVNDTDGNLMNMYRVAKLYPSWFKEQVSITLYCQKSYRESLFVNLPKNASPRQRAVAYYMNLHMPFFNHSNAGWGKSVYGGNHASGWGRRDVDAAVDRLRKVHICHEDALRVISRWDSPQTFFYCDPPYVGTWCNHYEGYTLDDYKKLICALDNIQGSFMLSSYLIPEVCYPKSWQCHTFDVHCSSDSHGKTRIGILD